MKPRRVMVVLEIETDAAAEILQCTASWGLFGTDGRAIPIRVQQVQTNVVRRRRPENPLADAVLDRIQAIKSRMAARARRRSGR